MGWVNALAEIGDDEELLELIASNELNIANLNEIDESSGMTPMMTALKHGHFKFAKMLFEHGGRIDDHVDNNGNTFLHWANYGGCLKCVKLVMANSNIQPTSKNHDGVDSFLTASSTGNLNQVKFLMEQTEFPNRQVDVNTVDKFGFNVVINVYRAGYRHNPFNNLLRFLQSLFPNFNPAEIDETRVVIDAEVDESDCELDDIDPDVFDDEFDYS